jgi:hypothetical protein
MSLVEAGSKPMKIARFVASSKELFYFVSSLIMARRYCENLTEAERIIAVTGISQKLVVVED